MGLAGLIEGVDDVWVAEDSWRVTRSGPSGIEEFGFLGGFASGMNQPKMEELWERVRARVEGAVALEVERVDGSQMEQVWYLSRGNASDHLRYPKEVDLFEVPDLDYLWDGKPLFLFRVEIDPAMVSACCGPTADDDVPAWVKSPVVLFDEAAGWDLDQPNESVTRSSLTVSVALVESVDRVTIYQWLEDSPHPVLVPGVEVWMSSGRRLRWSSSRDDGGQAADRLAALLQRWLIEGTQA